MRKLASILFCLIEDVIRHVSGPIGVRLRRFYYTRRFKKCGSNLSIAPGVSIDRPDCVSAGDWVLIDRNCVILAGPASEAGAIKEIANPECTAQPGEVIIGDRAHISIGCVIQGHGGVSIGDAFAASTGSLIYSLSNSLYTTKLGPVAAAGSPLARVRTPVAIGNNVWLGLHSVVIGNTIGDDCFIKPMSVVVSNIPANSIAGGNPAQREKERYRDATPPQVVP